MKHAPMNRAPVNRAPVDRAPSFLPSSLLPRTGTGRARFRAAAAVALLLFLAPSSCGASPSRKATSLDRISLPPGFSIGYFADRVPGARSLALGPGGTVFVGTRDEGKVYALRDEDGNGTAERIFTIASGLNQPNGVAVRGGDLYVAEVSRILRFPGIEARLASPPPFELVTDAYPRDNAHGWKFIAFGPDSLLYVPVGAPCNVCLPKDEIYAGITRIRPDGSGREIFARGIRNTVGFDWHPQTGVLWFTDNGRDYLGDDAPPDELNAAPRAGMHFGFPFCHGDGIPDPEFGKDHNCADYAKPMQLLGPHVAALGMRFYTGGMFPAPFRGAIFIAEHGSWNRSRKSGYRVTVVRLEGDRPVSYEPFAQGWLQGQDAWGRPVDLLVLPDGSMLVSDDRLGAVYRITYEAEGSR